MPANLENSAVATGLEKVSFNFNPKECSNYHTIAVISHASKVMLKILQARLQQYLNHDYDKGFDCVDRNKLWKILKEMGIPDHMICLLRNLYAGKEATVRTGHGTTVCFQIGKNWTWNNSLLPNRKRSTSRLYIVTLLI